MAIQPYQLNGYQEDVLTPFFRLNKIAVPGRVTTFTSTGGKKQPTVQGDYLHVEDSGKIRPAVAIPSLDVYLDNPYNVS